MTVLSAALQNADQILGTIRGLAAPPPPAAQKQAELVQSGSALLPDLGRARTELAGFTETSIRELAELTATIARGEPLASIAASLHTLGTGFAVHGEVLGPLVKRLDGFRDAATETVAALRAEQIVLTGQLAGLAAQREHWQEEEDSLSRQNIATTVLTCIFGPLVWAGSELASAIQYGKSTEAAAAETTENLARLSAEAHTLQAGLDSCALLGTAAGQLGGSVQGLADSVSLIQADLTNDAVRAHLADEQTARLFLAALNSAMTVLKTGLE